MASLMWRMQLALFEQTLGPNGEMPLGSSVTSVPMGSYALGPHMLMRCSGSRYMPSPSVTPSFS